MEQYSSDIWLQRGDGRANAKSVVSLMSLDVRCNDKVTLVAQGLDAHNAIANLVPQIAQGIGEEGTPAPAPASRLDQFVGPFTSCCVSDSITPGRAYSA